MPPMNNTLIPSPDKLPELLSSAKALEQAGQYVQAYQVLQQCDALLMPADEGTQLWQEVKQGLWRLAPIWWSRVKHDGLSLRRCRGEDADFFIRCYADATFANQFNRQPPWRGKLEEALHNSGLLPPLQTGSVQWVVESATRGPIGLASLSSLDTQNLRAELSVGMPGDVPATLGIKATLMMLHFGMFMMPFNKIYAYTYEDNPQALHNALRLGFLHEGKLQDHFHIPGHGFVSVNLVALTRAQLQANADLKKLAKRKIGQSW